MADTEEAIERIRREFRARDRTIPPDFYAWHRPEIQYWQRQTARVCRKLLQEAAKKGHPRLKPVPHGLVAQTSVCDLTDAAIADIGCGTGQWLAEFLQWDAQPANLHGVDLLEERIDSAHARLPTADLRCGDARHLPWPDDCFDLVTQFTVFSSILDTAIQREVAREMLRVLRPGGRILWYDCRYSNPARAAVRGLNRRQIARLFPNCAIRFSVTTLVPPFSRVIARHSHALAAALESLRFTCTHLAAVITPETE